MKQPWKEFVEGLRDRYLSGKRVALYSIPLDDVIEKIDADLPDGSRAIALPYRPRMRTYPKSLI
jgi:hypothetical protein